MVRDEDSAQLNSCSYKRNDLFIWHASCSYGPRKNDEKINQNTHKVLALLQLHTNSLPYHVGEDLAGVPFVGGFYGDEFLCLDETSLPSESFIKHSICKLKTLIKWIHF